MAAITLTQISNGDNGNATTVDNNFDLIAAAINGGLDNTNLSDSAEVAASKLAATIPIRKNTNTSNATYQAATRRRIEIGGGYIAINGTSGTTAITFDTAFPSASKIVVLLNPAGGTSVLGDSLANARDWLVFVQDVTTTGFTLQWNSRDGTTIGSNYGFFWMAIGEAS